MAIHKCETKRWKKSSRARRRRRSITNEQREHRQRYEKAQRAKRNEAKKTWKQEVKKAIDAGKVVFDWLFKKRSEGKHAPEHGSEANHAS